MRFKFLLLAFLVLSGTALWGQSTPSFGLGYASTMRVPLEMGAVALLVNSRVGGFLSVPVLAFPGGSFNLDAEAWALLLPANQLIVMLELPLMLSAAWRTPESSVEVLAGYCMILGSGEDVSLINSLAVGGRFTWRSLFLQCQLYAPLNAPADMPLLPHVALGWHWK
jgi:hypothetical protein